MTYPSISICILNHNYGRYLHHAINSALQQTPGPYQLAEILVVDDGSTDNSLDVCAHYRDRIRIITRSNRGFGATLTDAVESAAGDWVALLDADDWFAPNKLATVAAAITDTCLLVQHWEHVVGTRGDPLLDRPHPGGNTSTLVVWREAALDLLPVTNEAFFHVLDDLAHGITLTEPLTCYRVHDANMTDRVNPGVFQEYLETVSTDVGERLRVLSQAPPPWASSRQLRRLAWHYKARARGHACEAAVQRRHRAAALVAASTGVVLALMARRAVSASLVELRSAATMRPLINIGDGAAPMATTGQQQ